MKFSNILKIAAIITIVALIVMMILSIIYDFDYQVRDFFTYLISSKSAFNFLITLFPTIFLGSAFIIWGFFRTGRKRKIYALIISAIVAIGLYVYEYYDSLYFDYIASNSPYDGYFIRDALKDEQSIAHKDLREGNPRYYQDTIGKTALLLNKHRAYLKGNRSSLTSFYNVCIQDDDIKIVAVYDFADTGNYCKPNSKIENNPVKFTLKRIENNKYFCSDCANYLLPMYWEFIGKQ